MIFRNRINEEVEIFKDFNQLLYLNILYKHSLKHDKEKDKRNIETIEEIFVESVELTNNLKEEYSKKRGMPRKSSYNSNFWESCNCELYQPSNEKTFQDMEEL